MKKIYLFASMATLALASCTQDSFIGEVLSEEAATENAPILFGRFDYNKSRGEDATGADAAALLNNNFVVYGRNLKGGVETAIFDNFNVNYVEGSAGSSSSNTAGWEYVGYTSKKGAAQNVKYWDFSAENYQFVAVAGAAAGDTIKNTTDGLRINVANAAEMTSIYVSDRVTATPTAKEATGTTPQTMAYKETVTLPFRRLGAQMRIGFYETIPGYAVKDLVFYYIGAPAGSYTVGVGSQFPASGKYSISYDDATDAAKVKFSGAQNNFNYSNTFGTLVYTSAQSQAGVAGKPYVAENGAPSATAVNKFLADNSLTPTYAKGTYTIDGQAGVYSDYKPILPNENNSLKMQLRVDYTLVALDGSNEEIHIRDAYVQVPVEYLQWKPNYSYTYLFKISDKSNGYTGDGGGGTQDPSNPGRTPDPDNGGGDNDPVVDPVTGDTIPPYIPYPGENPDPDNPTPQPYVDPETGDTIPPYIPNPDFDPTQPEGPDNPGEIINPELPVVPNPNYPTGPEGDQHDPSNPVPTPVIPNPDYDPTQPEGPDNPKVIEDPENPKNLFPITFDAVVTSVEEKTQTIYTVIKDEINSSETEHE